MALFEDVFKTYSRTAASHEKIRRFSFVADPFTVDNGYMTPTMKLKRKVISDAFKESIEEMYAGVV